MVDKTKHSKSKIFEDIRKIQIIIGALGAALLVAYFNLNTKINQLSSDNIETFISELNDNNTKIQFYENEVSKLKKSLDITNNDFDSLSKQITSTKVGLVDRYDSLLVAYKEMALIEKEKLLFNDIDSEKARYKSNWRKLTPDTVPSLVISQIGEPTKTKLMDDTLYYYYLKNSTTEGVVVFDGGFRGYNDARNYKFLLSSWTEPNWD